MTDLNTLTKDAINALLAAPLTASQLKKKSKADLIAMFDAMPAADALDADLRDARADDTPPTEPTLVKVLDDSDALHAAESPDAGELDDNRLLETLATLTPAEQHLLVAFARCENNVTNGAPKQAKVAADLATWVWLDDRSVGNMTVKQKKGVLSSLVKKSLVTVTPDSEGDLIGFTDAGFDAVMALLDDQLPEIETPAPKADSANADKPARKARTLEDRVIQKPATDLAKVRPMSDGSKRHLLAQAMQRGATLEHLIEVTGWSRSTVTSALRWDMGQVGLGVERKGDKYFLIMPEGLKRLPVREATISRADALVAACK